MVRRGSGSVLPLVVVALTALSLQLQVSAKSMAQNGIDGDMKRVELVWSPIKSACIKGNNYKIFYKVSTIDDCKEKCISELHKSCHSIDYNTAHQECYISKANSDSEAYEEPCRIGRHIKFTERNIISDIATTSTPRPTTTPNTNIATKSTPRPTTTPNTSQNGVCDGKAKGRCTKKGGSCVTKPFANNCKALHGDGGKLKKKACRSKNCQCCLPGLMRVRSDKFMKFDQEISWNAARDLCRSQGLSLYKPKNFLAVAKYLDNTSSNTYYWLDARGNGNQMIRLSGEVLTGNLPWYSSGEREDVDTVDCLYFKLNEHLQDDEVLKAGDCDKGRSVLCG